MSVDYEAKWSQFWPNRNLYRFAIYGASIPLLILLALMDPHPALRPATACLLLVYFGIMMWWRWKLLAWPCPNCHRPFYKRWGGVIPFARHCAHCGAQFPRSGPA